jgi:hypothetical protein
MVTLLFGLAQCDQYPFPILHNGGTGPATSVFVPWPCLGEKSFSSKRDKAVCNASADASLPCSLISRLAATP